MAAGEVDEAGHITGPVPPTLRPRQPVRLCRTAPLLCKWGNQHYLTLQFRQESSPLLGALVPPRCPRPGDHSSAASRHCPRPCAHRHAHTQLNLYDVTASTHPRPPHPIKTSLLYHHLLRPSHLPQLSQPSHPLTTSTPPLLPSLSITTTTMHLRLYLPSSYAYLHSYQALQGKETQHTRVPSRKCSLTHLTYAIPPLEAAHSPSALNDSSIKPSASGPLYFVNPRPCHSRLIKFSSRPCPLRRAGGHGKQELVRGRESGEGKMKGGQ